MYHIRPQTHEKTPDNFVPFASETLAKHWCYVGVQSVAVTGMIPMRRLSPTAGTRLGAVILTCVLEKVRQRPLSDGHVRLEVHGEHLVQVARSQRLERAGIVLTRVVHLRGKDVHKLGGKIQQHQLAVFCSETMKIISRERAAPRTPRWSNQQLARSRLRLSSLLPQCESESYEQVEVWFKVLS